MNNYERNVVSKETSVKLDLDNKLWPLVLEHSNCKKSEREAILKRIKELQDAEQG